MKEYTPETGEQAHKILEIAIKRRARCIEAETTRRTKQLDDIRFAAGDQWPVDIKQQREIERKPALTINKCGKFIRQVENDARKNAPAIKAFPVGSGGDQEIAEVFNGLMRDIQQRSDAETAYDTAVSSAARCGEGYFRLLSQYVGDDSFDQELAFQRIRNPHSVHIDPAAIDPTGADANFAFVDSWIPLDEYREDYGELAAQSLEDSIGESEMPWMKDGSVLVAEYFTVETEQKRTLVLMKSGGTQILEELPEPPDEDEIVGKREVRLARVIWRKITADKILEKTIWPCRYIPVFRVIGEEWEIDGKVDYKGMIRDMKDSARMNNYWMSSATFKGALETIAPYIGAAGQFDGYEEMWKNANRIPYAFLEYNPVDVNGTLAPPPQRKVETFQGQADLQMAQLAAADLQDIVGIYNPSLGAESQEKSGKAILARQEQSDTGTFHYLDNLKKATKQAGRVLVEVIPKYYSTERVVRLVAEDGSEKTATINGVEKDATGRAIRKINDITVGRYDVRVDSGPSYATKRLEAADSMIAFVQAIPNAGQAVMDLVAKNMDWPGAEEISERLRKLLPPGIGEDDDENSRQAAFQQQVQALQMQLEQAAGQIEAMQKDNGFKLQIEQIKQQTSAIKAQSDLEVAKYNAMTRQAELQSQSEQQTQSQQDSMAIIRDDMASVLAEQIKATQALMDQIQQANKAVIDKIQEVEDQEDEKPKAKVIRLRAPSGAEYTGEIHDQGVTIKAPSGATYKGTVKEASGGIER